MELRKSASRETRKKPKAPPQPQKPSKKRRYSQLTPRLNSEEERKRKKRIFYKSKEKSSNERGYNFGPDEEPGELNENRLTIGIKNAKAQKKSLTPNRTRNTRRKSLANTPKTLKTPRTPKIIKIESPHSPRGGDIEEKVRKWLEFMKLVNSERMIGRYIEIDEKMGEISEINGQSIFEISGLGIIESKHRLLNLGVWKGKGVDQGIAGPWSTFELGQNIDVHNIFGNIRRIRKIKGIVTKKRGRQQVDIVLETEIYVNKEELRRSEGVFREIGLFMSEMGDKEVIYVPREWNGLGYLGYIDWELDIKDIVENRGNIRRVEIVDARPRGRVKHKNSCLYYNYYTYLLGKGELSLHAQDNADKRPFILSLPKTFPPHFKSIKEEEKSLGELKNINSSHISHNVRRVPTTPKTSKSLINTPRTPRAQNTPRTPRAHNTPKSVVTKSETLRKHLKYTSPSPSEEECTIIEKIPFRKLVRNSKLKSEGREERKAGELEEDLKNISILDINSSKEGEEWIPPKKHSRRGTYEQLEKRGIDTSNMSREHLEVYDKAYLQLELKTVPDRLPCRENEYSRIENFIRSGIEQRGCTNTLYISGMPGTGKTATVLEVIHNLTKLSKASKINRFSFIHIKGMALENPFTVYTQIYQSITGHTTSPGNASAFLDDYFKKGEQGRNINKRIPILAPGIARVLLVDELDALVTKKQNIIYNIFDWPSYSYANLIVVAIANTMNLPETLLPKIASRMGNERLVYQPYNKQQIMEILKDRLKDINVFHDLALNLICMKVAALSGDMRRCLQVCRKSCELAKLQYISQSLMFPQAPQLLLCIDHVHVNKATCELYNSKNSILIRSLTAYQQLALLTVVIYKTAARTEQVEIKNCYDRFMANITKYEKGRDREDLLDIKVTMMDFETILYNLRDYGLLSIQKYRNMDPNRRLIQVLVFNDEVLTGLEPFPQIADILSELKDSL